MAERVAAVVMVLIGAGAALWALQIGYGTMLNPGPGFVPFWLALILAFVSSMYFFQVSSSPKSEPVWEPGAWRRPILSSFVILLYIAVLDWLGFICATFFLFAAWVGFIEKESRRRTLLVSVIGTICLYVVFVYLLDASVPSGVLI